LIILAFSKYALAVNYYVSPDGAGTACNLKDPCSLDEALDNQAGNDDNIKLMAGIYFLSRTAPYNIPGSGVTIESVSGIAEDVVLNCSAFDANSIFILAGPDNDSGTIKNITIQDYNYPGGFVVIVDNADNFVAEGVRFIDNVENLNIYNGSFNPTIKRCEFAGQRSASNMLQIDADGARFQYCISRPSATFASGSWNIKDSSGLYPSVYIDNCYISGSKTDCISVSNPTVQLNVTNSIILGCGANYYRGSYAIGGYLENTTVDHCSTNRNQYTYEVAGGEVINSIDRGPFIKSHVRYGILTIGVDDAGCWNYFYETLRPELNKQGWHGTCWLNTSGLYKISKIEIAAAISEGHDIQLHSHSHSRMNKRNAIEIDGPADSDISIAFSNRPTDLSGGQDLSNVLDSDKWTISVVCRENISETPVTVLNKTVTGALLSDIINWIDQNNGWTASLSKTNGSVNYKNYSKAGILDVQTNEPSDILTLKIDVNAMHHIEISEAKYDLERWVGTATGQPYKVTGWSSPFNYSDDELRNRLQKDGFLIGRCGSMADASAQAYPWDLQNLSIFEGKPFYSFNWKKENGDPSQKYTEGLLASAAELGAYLSTYFHNDSASFNDFTAIEFDQWLGWIRPFFDNGDIKVLNQSEAAAYIRTNATCRDRGNNQACNNDTAGIHERWQINFEDGFKGRLLPDSALIDAGLNDIWYGSKNVIDFEGKSITDSEGYIISEGGIVDIGAYEYTNLDIRGDWDLDGDVDGMDLSRFILAYLNNKFPDADINNDGFIDSADIEYYARFFGKIFITTANY